MIVVRCDLVSCPDPLKVNVKQVLWHLLRVSTLCLPDIIACNHWPVLQGIASTRTHLILFADDYVKLQRGGGGGEYGYTVYNPERWCYGNHKAITTSIQGCWGLRSKVVLTCFYIPHQRRGCQTEWCCTPTKFLTLQIVVLALGGRLFAERIDMQGGLICREGTLVYTFRTHWGQCRSLWCRGLFDLRVSPAPPLSQATHLEWGPWCERAWGNSLAIRRKLTDRFRSVFIHFHLDDWHLSVVTAALHWFFIFSHEGLCAKSCNNIAQ